MIRNPAVKHQLPGKMTESADEMIDIRKREVGLENVETIPDPRSGPGSLWLTHHIAGRSKKRQTYRRTGRL